MARYSIYWRISSFPELEYLSDEDRRVLVRQAAGPRLGIRMIGRAAVLGLWWSIAAVSTLAWLGLRLNSTFIPAAWPVFAILVYQVYLIRIRGQLRMYLEKAARHQALPMCLNCGYDLTGTTDRCPECGRPLPPAAKDQPP